MIQRVSYGYCTCNPPTNISIGNIEYEMFFRRRNKGPSVAATSEVAQDLEGMVLMTREEEDEMKRNIGISDASISVLWQHKGKPGPFVFINVTETKALYDRAYEGLVEGRGRDLEREEAERLFLSIINDQDFWHRESIDYPDEIEWQVHPYHIESQSLDTKL